MKVHPQDLELFKQVRGTFTTSRKSTLSSKFYSILFGLVLPVIFLIAVIKEGVSNDLDGWTVIIMIPLSFGLGAILWYFSYDKYELTDHAVVLFRRKKKIKEFYFNDIEDARISVDIYGNTTMTLSNSERKFTMPVYPSLQEEINRLKTELGG